MIYITETLRISRLDRWNFTLEDYAERVNPKSKEVSQGWAHIGYFPNVESAIKHLHNTDGLVNDEEASTVLEYIAEIAKANEKLLKALEKVDD